jgi:hypothetical protein
LALPLSERRLLSSSDGYSAERETIVITYYEPHTLDHRFRGVVDHGAELRSHWNLLVSNAGGSDHPGTASQAGPLIYNLTSIIMPRKLYTPKLSDDVVRALYREGLRRRQPMTVVADTLLRQSLGRIANDPPLLRVCEDPKPYSAKIDNPDAA